MTKLIWRPFDKIAGLVENERFESVAETVDALVNASIDTAVDALGAAPAEELREGAAAAKSALDAMSRNGLVERGSALYLAGRLSATIDFLAIAAAQNAGE